MKALMAALVISLATNFILGCLLWRTTTADKPLAFVNERIPAVMIPDRLEMTLLEVPKLSVSQDLLLKSLFLDSETKLPSKGDGRMFESPVPEKRWNPRFQMPPKRLMEDPRLPADPFDMPRGNQLKRGLYVSPSSVLTS